MKIVYMIKMIKRIWIVSLFCFSINFTSQAQTPSSDPTWTYNTVVSDEFTVSPSTIDATKWYITSDWRNTYGCRCYTTGISPNQAVHIGTLDLQAVRTPTNYQLLSGSGEDYLRIITKKSTSTNVPRASWCGSSPFNTVNCISETLTPTTVSLTMPYSTLNEMKSTKWLKYGFFEIQARFPVLTGTLTNNGLGANFWLSAAGANKDGGESLYSEIDVFEILGANANGVAPAKHEWGLNSHFATYTVPLQGCGNCYTIPNDGAWHTWAVSWTPNSIHYYFDGSLQFISFLYPSQMEPLEIFIDVNVFKFIEGNGATIDPYNYEINYVRVYGLNTSQKNTCYINNSGPNFNSIVGSVYQCIELGNGTISSSQQKEQNLRATNYIQFGPGFTVGSGTPFYAECMSDPSQQTY